MCDHCTRAKAGIWGGIQAKCRGCRARLIARAQAMFRVMTGRGCTEEERKAARREVRDQIVRGLGVTFEEGKPLVMTWWRIDHPDIPEPLPSQPTEAQQHDA